MKHDIKSEGILNFFLCFNTKEIQNAKGSTQNSQ